MQLKLIIFRNGLKAYIGIWNASSLILSLGSDLFMPSASQDSLFDILKNIL